MNATQKPEALALAQEYRVTTPESVLHLWAADARDTMRRQHARIAELEDAADIAIERIAELEAQLSAIGAGGVEPLRGSRHAHECREALAACINLLKKTPKITRDIYVGKDRQAWGVQAKAVLDAALVALNQEGGK